MTMESEKGEEVGVLEKSVSGFSDSKIGTAEDNGANAAAQLVAPEEEQMSAGVGVWQETVREVVMVPREKFGAVIGRSGRTIRRMQEEWGVTMRLRGTEGVREAPMEIVGDPLAVAAAATMLKDFLNDEMTFRPYDPLSAQQGLRETNYSTLDLLPAHNAPHVPKASPEEEFSQRLAHAFGAAEVPPSNLEICFQEVKVPGESVGRIIGRNGDMIRKIMDETHAFIQFAPNEERFAHERTLLMRGTLASIQAAQNIVTDIVRRVQKYGHA